MGLLLPKNTSNESKKFNGIRRTPEGMLYLTSIDPNGTAATTIAN